MRGEDGVDCEFCDLESFRDAEILITGELTFFAGAFASSQVLPGGGIICPVAHRESPFEMSTHEWAETRTMLHRARAVIDERLSPDGYNLVWNVNRDAGQEVAHAHLHLIPRFNDEPLAGRGARWYLKQDHNRRPDPLAPGRAGRSASRVEPAQ